MGRTATRLTARGAPGQGDHDGDRVASVAPGTRRKDWQTEPAEVAAERHLVAELRPPRVRAVEQAPKGGTDVGRETDFPAERAQLGDSGGQRPGDQPPVLTSRCRAGSVAPRETSVLSLARPWGGP